MKPFWILVICILAYSDYPIDDGFVDYAADFDSTAIQAPQDPPNYFTDESTGRTVADASDSMDPSKDPGLTGGSTEPAADEATEKKDPKTAAEEEADYYKECRDKGYAAEQCCKTCVESYLSNWAEETCVDEADCEARQFQSAEAAVREGSERGSASQSEGVGVGN